MVPANIEECRLENGRESESLNISFADKSKVSGLGFPSESPLYDSIYYFLIGLVSFILISAEYILSVS